MSQQADVIQGVATRTLLGIALNQLPLASLVARALHAVDQPAEAPFTFACANPHSLVVARRDPYFRQCLRSASAVVADGIGVKLAGMISGGQFGPRITGWDFFHATMSELDRRGGKVFFFGSRTEVLDLLAIRAAGDYPGRERGHACTHPRLCSGRTLGRHDGSTPGEVDARQRAARQGASCRCHRRRV